MAITRSVSAVFAAGVVTAGAIAATISTSPAWADGPGGEVEPGVMSRAVGSGVIDGMLVGYMASGATNDEAEAAVIAVCEGAGADQCTSDEVTNADVCVVSIGEDDSGLVAGGAGHTIEEAFSNAVYNAAEFDQVLHQTGRILISSCV
ncbi:MAG: hypothetical protein WAM92_15855 [Mycobacterium sp.]